MKIVEKKGPFLVIVYSFCFLLLGSSIFSLFMEEEPGKIESNFEKLNIDTILSDTMSNFTSGVVGGHETNIVSLTPVGVGENFLVNDLDGYSIRVPKEWKLDDKECNYVIHLRNESMKITVFKHVVSPSFENVTKYISYSNSNIYSDYGPITFISKESRILGGLEYTMVTYDREQIVGIENDMPKYRQYHFIPDNRTIFTFIVKTNEASWDLLIPELESSLETFQFWDVGSLPIDPPVPEKEVEKIDIVGEGITLSIPDQKKIFGLWHQVHDEYWTELSQLQEEVDYDFDLVMDYFNFNSEFDMSSEYIHKQYDEGNVMLISLQPYISSHGKDFDGNVVIFDMLNGDYDQYLIDWARGLKDLGEPVFLRFGNEMNGDWTQWCSWFYGLDPDIFIMAWARIHTIFEYVGADNVQFVWNPHDRTYPDYDWQAQYLYYPGDDMVDWIGLTAYNNGVTRPTEVWRDFEECYSDLYDDYMRRFSSKPFMITEFACNEIGGNKSEWIETGLESLFRNYPNIWMAVWWNGIDDTWIYDIDSTEVSLQAFKEAMKDPALVEGPVGRR